MEVEWLILADAAQVTSNKLYLLGGGWDRLVIARTFPVTHQMAVATAFRVSWNETNQKHDFEIEVVDADGTGIAKLAGQFEVGRPPGIPPGQDQRTQIAVNLGLPLKHPGTYEVVARLNGEESRRFPFNVVAHPNLS
jgi:hypothetical protein